MADYAIHDTTLIAQANILRKKFGTNDRQDPAEYAYKMNLMGLLEEKTASGSIAHITDGADEVPTKSVKVTIPPTLSGVSSVSVTQTGANQWNGQWENGSINNTTVYTASLGRTIYGGEVDIVNGVGTDENGNDFTFDGQEIPTRLGYNAFWSDSGDTEVTYRSSGTVTPVLPTLISKTITENGTYSAKDDGADGYDEVTVNVSGDGTIIVDDLIEYPYPNNDNKCIYSSELNTQYAYYAFNPDCGNPFYWSSVGATNQYIGWKFDTAQIVNCYEIWTRNVGNQYDYLQAPKEWKLQGSNDDGNTWIDLDAQDFTFTASGQKWASAVNNTTAYKWYRIFVITAQDTSNDTVIGYIDFKHAYIAFADEEA